MIPDAHIVRLWGMRCVVERAFSYHCHLRTLYKMCISLGGIWLSDSRPPSDHDLVGRQRQFKANAMSQHSRTINRGGATFIKGALEGNIAIQDISRCLARNNHICMGVLSTEYIPVSRWRDHVPVGFIPSLWTSDIESPMPRLAPAS